MMTLPTDMPRLPIGWDLGPPRHDFHVQEGEFDEALDAVLGESAGLLTPGELKKLIPQLQNRLGQLIRIGIQCATGEWSPELLDLVVRYRRLGNAPVPDDFVAARGRARLLALTTVDAMDMLATEDDGPAQERGRWFT